MGREVRRVPANWEHPLDEQGHYRPLLDRSFAEAAREWKEGFAAWERGERPDYYSTEGREREPEFWEYRGDPPDADDYRPEWDEAERTHIQMYETCSEGTPISPVFPADQPEALARWLADNAASAFGGMTASYEAWLSTIRRGSSIGAIFDSERGFRSGVELEGEMSEGEAA